MILTDEVQNALNVLSNAAENDFELLAIKRLYQALFKPPAIEIVDDNHRKFDGITYTKHKSGHYSYNTSLHRAVYQYYCGEIPDGYVIHHIDEDKENNELDNLMCLTPADHKTLHNLLDNFPDRKLHEFTCENCGKKYFSASNGRNRFCSPQCFAEYLKKNKIYYEIRKCAYCGKDFEVLRHSPTLCCSRTCAGKFMTGEGHAVKKCAVCGKEFESQRHQRRKYCSQKCAKIALSKYSSETRTCQICNKEFRVRADSSKRFCSLQCAGVAKRKVISKVCPFCGKTFEILASKRRTFCSRECIIRHYSATHREVRKCLNCGKEFEIQKHEPNKFCSRDCANQYRRGKS